MPLLYIKRYDRALIQAHPDWLFVFGDNFERAGFGGQAKYARGEPNALGIPTKRAPGRKPEDYLSNADFDEWNRASYWERCQIEIALRAGKVVIWPLDGIGTGLADLRNRSWMIWKEIERFRALMESILCSSTSPSPPASS